MFYEAQILCQRGQLGKVWIAAHWDKKLSKKAVDQVAFRPAGTIDMDERAVALGTIALDTEDIGGYELEFPAIEDEFNLLPESDDNLLSLHDARKQLVVAPSSRTPSMLSEGSSAAHFNFQQDVDLLPPTGFQEIHGAHEDSIELQRGGATDVASQASILAPEDDWPELDYSALAKSHQAEETGIEYGEGADWQEPAGLAPTDLEHIPEEEMPPPKIVSRRRRRHVDLMDEEATQLPHEFLQARITNPHFFDGRPRDLAPPDYQQIKRRKLEELPNDEFIFTPLLKQIPRPLRENLRNAIFSTFQIEGAAPMDILQTGTQRSAVEEPEQVRGGRPSIGSQYSAMELADASGRRVSLEGDTTGGGIGFDAMRETRFFGLESSSQGEGRLSALGSPVGSPVGRLSRVSESALPATPLQATPFSKEVSTSTSESSDLSLYSLALLEHFHTEIRHRYPSDPIDTHSFDFTTEFTAPAFKSRRNVAASFLALMELKTKEFVEIEQVEPYGDISFNFMDKAIPIRA